MYIVNKIQYLITENKEITRLIYYYVKASLKKYPTTCEY